MFGDKIEARVIEGGSAYALASWDWVCVNLKEGSL